MTVINCYTLDTAQAKKKKFNIFKITNNNHFETRKKCQKNVAIKKN